MNILYTITSYPPSMGGAQLYIHEIAKRASKEHNVRVITFFDANRNDWLLGTTLKTPEIEMAYIYEGVSVKQISFDRIEKFKMLPFVCAYYLNKRCNIYSISKFIEKRLYFDGFNFDLIHNVRIGREPLSYASYNLAKKLNIPFVFTPLHHPKWSHWFYKEYQDLYLKADGLFALTPHEKELFKDLGVKEESIFITGTGPVISEKADSERFRKKYNLSGNIVLFIAQGYKYKGIAELLAATKIVFKQAKNTNFVFIGPHTSYSEGLFKKHLDTKIMHLGKVDLQTKTDALSACDIFCLPSTQESFGAVFLEAWSFEKPVIGADIPQLRCIIRDGENGYLILPNPENIAKKIIELINNVDLRRKFGQAGKEIVKNSYAWDILYEKTVNVYEEILEKKQKS